jgi:hypothetical protein
MGYIPAKSQNGEPNPMSEPAYPTVKAIRDALLTRAAEFTRITGMSAAEIGKRALKDPAFVYKARDGRNFTVQSYRKLMTWLDRRWPPDSVPAANGHASPKPKKRRRRASARS